MREIALCLHPLCSFLDLLDWLQGGTAGSLFSLSRQSPWLDGVAVRDKLLIVSVVAQVPVFLAGSWGDPWDAWS